MSKFRNFVSDLGKTAADAALDGLAQGIRENELTNRYTTYYSDDNSSIFGITGDNNVNLLNPLFDNNVGIYKNQKSVSANSLTNTSQWHKFRGPTKTLKTDDNYISETADLSESASINDEELNIFRINNEGDDTDIYKLKLPSWGYDDFINERNIFLRHLSSGFDIPNWLYFKIFFEFDTNFGLFGGIMNDAQNIGTNCAHNYLLKCSTRYRAEKISDRWHSLRWFVKLLSYINIYAPWFFKNIKNLSEISNPYILNLGDEKYIEIELDQDAIDMRITTLLSLYKYACFDDMNQKEIIPENLRKFNMCLVLFSSPLNGIHNIPTEAKEPQLKRVNYTNPNDTSNLMSFKLYKFINCEIDTSTIGGYVPSEITNEEPFQLGKNTLKIKFDRVYEYNMNEFMGIMIGSDGYYFANTEIEVKDSNNVETFADSFIHNKIASLLGTNVNYALGNIYGQDRALYREKINGPAVDKENTGTKYLTDYAKAKFGLIVKNKNSILDIGFDKLYQLLGTSYKAGTSPGPYGDGTVLNGHGKYGIGSAVWNAKIERQLKGGGLTTREKRLYALHNYENFDLMKYLHDKALKKGY